MLFLGYLLLQVSAPIPRILVDWPQDTLVPFLYGFKSLPMIPILLFILWLNYIKSRFISDRWFFYKPWLVLLLALFITIVPTGIYQDLTRIPIHPMFASWRGAGLGIVLFLVIFTTLRDKLKPGEAWFVAIFSSLLVLGLWEAIYQIANYFIIYKPYFPISALFNEIITTLAYIFPASVIIITYSIKYKMRINPVTVGLLGIFVVMWVVWLLMGYWIEVYADHTMTPVTWVYNNPIDYTQLLLGRTTKVVLALSVLSLVRGTTWLTYF